MKKLFINSIYSSITDKQQYSATYERLFEDIWDNDIKILELGVGKKGCMYVWRDNFTKALIYGIDNNSNGCTEDRIRIFRGNQQDTVFLKKVIDETGMVDVIIDDASHIGEYSKKSFDYLFYNGLKNGGMYIVEDWGTGYWDGWTDGHCLEDNTGFKNNRLHTHDYGMVGFIKNLIDYIGLADATCERGESPQRESGIREIMIRKSIAVVYKK